MPMGSGKRPREEPGAPTDEAAARDSARSALEARDAAATPLDRVVVLNVGGTMITTLHSTLCSSPSLLAQWAENNFQEFPRDLQGHPFLDRDPENFVHILNYLRGYGLPKKADDLVVVAEDAELYQLESLKREIGLDPPLMWRFTPGPGVRDDGVEYSTSDILDLCGTEPLSTGLAHTIVFRVDKCELVSIGVVAFKEIQHDIQIRRQKNTVCYCNTGELVRYWSADALYEQGVLYKSQDEITVRVDFAQPGVPLEPLPSSASLTVEPLPPPLQPALSLSSSAPLPVGIASAATLGGGGGGAITVVPARPLPLTLDASATTMNASSGAEPPLTSPAFQPGSPAMGMAATRLLQPGSSSPTTAPATPTAVPTAQLLGGGIGGGGGGSGSGGGGGVTAGTAPTHAVSSSAAPGSSTGATSASPSLPFSPVVLDPDDPDATVGAVVTFFKGDREVCRARWPAPVPPLQFAVSMQGASGVSILKTSSISADAVGAENEE
ncbi:BTB/POZ domain containing protein [Novymonas esmeraldas]|uniref:BTB/POZ domain containing protein n=1 Tax=Novymonas esmeraldas TaxID=1808958 RepID=A0AAW0F5R2_9TRYP